MTAKKRPVRQPGWEVAFADTVARHQALPLVYGESDCLIQIVDLDLAMTGHDPMKGLRGEYDDRKSAVAALKKLGFASIEAALAGTYAEVEPSLARRGDCGLVETGDPKDPLAAVIVLGDMVMGKPLGTEGVHYAPTFLPRDRLVRAFQIG
jgi:uncharacterized protein DUF6950